MPTATAVNPRKKFRFAIEIDGLEKAFVKKVKVGEHELTIAEHNAGNSPHSIGTASREKFGDIELEHIMPADGAHTFFEDWLKQAQITAPSQAKKDFDVIQYGNDGASIVGKWSCKGGLPKKIVAADLEGGQDEDYLETVTLWIDRYDRT